MSLEAQLSISGEWNDLHEETCLTVLKRCGLSINEKLTGGKVIVVSGITDDSGGVTIDPADTGYKNAAGETVVLSEVSRILLTGDPGVSARFGTGAVIIKAVGGRIAATCCIGAGDKNVKLEAIEGTSTYTLIMWQAD